MTRVFNSNQIILKVVKLWFVTMYQTLMVTFFVGVGSCNFCQVAVAITHNL